MPDLAEFGNSLDGESFSPGSPGYEAIRRPVNLAYRDVCPRLVVRCRSVSDVVSAVTYATATGDRIAPRGEELVSAWQTWAPDAPDAPDDLTVNLTLASEPGAPVQATLFGASTLEEGSTRELLQEFDGDTPSQVFDGFKLSEPNARFFDAIAARVGAAVAGRTTYEHSGYWGGGGPHPAAQLFVVVTAYHRTEVPSFLAGRVIAITPGLRLELRPGRQHRRASTQAAAGQWGCDRQGRIEQYEPGRTSGAGRSACRTRRAGLGRRRPPRRVS